jgi:hypothetical protein
MGKVLSLLLALNLEASLIASVNFACTRTYISYKSE